jgi:hypothetical protein
MVAKVTTLQILVSGRIDDRDSAFPQTIELPNGDLLCSFGVGGGPSAHGGTEMSRSRDAGGSWEPAGPVLAQEGPTTSNFLKLTRSAAADDGSYTIFAYGSRMRRTPGDGFGSGETDAIIVTSEDGGTTWGDPRIVPFESTGPLEVSHGALVLGSGRLLAPAATLPGPDRLGEQVLAAVSDDGGRTWPRQVVVLQDPAGKHGYFEQKLAELPDGRVLATAWTVTLDGVADRENSYALSTDAGLTWSRPQSTGIMGQTLATVPVGGDQVLVLFNRRYGQQGVVMLLATVTDDGWQLGPESMLYDAQQERQRPSEADGVAELNSFEFGFPTGVRLRDGSILVTHWSKEAGQFGIRWTRVGVA